jgi:hypothetical protein
MEGVRSIEQDTIRGISDYFSYGSKSELEVVNSSRAWVRWLPYLS